MLPIPSQFPARSIPDFRKGMAPNVFALLGTRVQFPAVSTVPREPACAGRCHDPGSCFGVAGLEPAAPMTWGD